MTHKLPANLLALFSPRPALRYLPASDHAPEERQTNNIGGVAQYLSAVQDYGRDTPYEATESWLQRKDRLKVEKQEREASLLKEGADRKPDKDPNIRGDAFKTLFVARLSYETTEKDLEREFSRFGPIERIRIVTDIKAESNGSTSENDAKPRKKKKPHRGYAFVVYEREKDMKGNILRWLFYPAPLIVVEKANARACLLASAAAYKETDGIRIKDRRVLVDVERGRTVKGWRPRRLGGGLGGRGYTKAAPARPTGFGGGFSAPAGPGGFGGGFRGGFRGGFDRGGFRGGFRGGDRGGYGGGRGGVGYQGGGGFGGRGGYGGAAPSGPGAAPPNAPSGPGGRGGLGGGYGGAPVNGHSDSGRGGYGGDSRRNEYDDRSASRGGGGGYGAGGGFTGSNREPVRPREDRERGYSRGREDDYDRKRPYDGGGYEDPRKLRRY